MKATLLRRRPISGKYYERWYDARGNCASVLFEDNEYQDWLGVFGKGDLVRFSTSILFSIGSAAFVVAGGQGYVVDVNSGELRYRTICDRLVGAIATPNRDLVIACDYTSLYALTSTEQIWRSERVAFDGIRLEHATPGHLSGSVCFPDGWHAFTLHYADWRFECEKRIPKDSAVLRRAGQEDSQPEDPEQIEHSVRDIGRASSLPASKPGDRIVLDPSIEQPENVFNITTYKELLEQARHLSSESNRLWQSMSSYPIEELPQRPEFEPRSLIHKKLHLLMEEYRSRLPIHLLAQCPYCGVHILQPVDSFSLLGFDGNFGAAKLYGGEYQWSSPPPRQRCTHALCATLSVSLNGLQPNDLIGWILGDKLHNRTMEIRASPYVMVWPLLARHTRAVIHALPIGRLDDEESIHRYTAYFVTYFVGDQSNLCDANEMWVANEYGGPAMGWVKEDSDLLRWVKADRLHWLDPDDTSQLVNGPPEAFPYANVRPKGCYYILRDGRLDGPNPHHWTWQGQVPSHDESYSSPIE
jgi:hypothetical protein